MTRFARLAAPLLIVAALLVGFPGTAQAVDLNPFNDCKVDPDITTPSDGAAASIDPGPANPRTGDPFATNPDTTVYEVFGWGGLQWINYDLGCGPDAIRAPDDTASGVIAKIGLTLLTWAAAAFTVLLRFAFNPDTLSVLDPVLRIGAKAFGDNIFAPLFGLTCLVTAIWMAKRAHKARLADTASDAGWVIGLAAIAVLSMTSSVAITPFFDRAVTGFVGTVNAEVSKATGTGEVDISTGIAANMQRAILLETWKAGMFGRYNGACVTKYGDQLYAASALTRTEDALPPGQRRDAAIAQHQKDYKAIAAKVQDEYPDCYKYLAGHRNSERIAFVFLGWLAFLASAWFEAVTGFLMLFALTVVRFAWMIVPLVVVVAALPTQRHRLTGIGDYAFGAVAAAVFFGSVTAAYVAAVGGILSPETNTNPFLAAVLLLVISVAVWKLTKPLRRIKALAFSRGDKKDRDGDGRNDTAQNRRDAFGRPFEPGPDGWRTMTYQWGDVTPAEAHNRPSVARSALVGAGQGAAATWALGAASGGAVTAGAVVAGATRGAVTAGGAAAATNLTGSPVVGVVTGMTLAENASRALEANPAPTADTAVPVVDAAPAPARPALPAGKHAGPDPEWDSTSEQATTTPPAAPPIQEPPVRIYRAGEGPEVPVPARQTERGTYDIYTPVEGA